MFMKKNILITWTSRWLWKYLVDNLKYNYEIIWISRAKIKENNFENICLDLTNFYDFDKILLKIWEKRVNTIIFNAWVWYFGKFEDASDFDYKNIINLNLLSPILLLQKVLPYLEEKANIIFIWSIAWKKFMKSAAVYQASKFAIRWFAWALKNELKWKKVFLINPKILETDFHKDSLVFIPNEKSKITSLENILEIIENILEKKENRFEIDL